jgi:hypothetical protein
MNIDDLENKLGIAGLSDADKLALVRGIEQNVAASKANIKAQEAGQYASLVVDAIKKIKSDLETRFNDLNGIIDVKAKSLTNGKDGIDGKNGRDGEDGRNGKDGISITGPKGDAGEDGQDGVGVQNAHIDFDGSLIIILTDGRELNVGEVVPIDVAEKIKIIGNGGGTSQSVLDSLASLQTQIDALGGGGGLSYQGTWNASTNTPTLTSSTGTNGYYYIVATAGSTDLNGITDWQIGDWLLFNGSTWQKIDQTNLVTSVAGRTGAVTLTSTDVGLANVENKSSATIRGEITSSNVTTALGYTPYNATNPAGYTTNTGTVTSVAVSGGTTGLTTSGGPVTGSGTITFAGTLAIANGGTGAITAGSALTALGAYAASNPSGYTSNTGTVTSVAALTLGTTGTDVSSTVANGTTTPVITLNIPTASATNRGALSATDWTTFNNKGSGTVTSVTGTSPVVSSGGATPAISLAASYGDTQNPFASKTANYVLAAPNGTAGAPTFRAIVAADIPTLNQNTTGTASNVTGTVAVANGGTGATTAGAALTNLGAYAASNPSGYTSNTGTVTSVGMTTPTGLTVTGSPVTTSGTLALSMTTGYSLSTTASQTTWDTAYGWGNHSSAGYLTSATAASTYAPLTGTGTSGTWGISITGNAATATNVAYSGLTGTVPTWNQNTTGTASNVTGTVAVANGGTGATTASGARTNLGLVIGTDVLAPTGSAASLTSFPTFNQNTTGTASNVTGTVAIANGGTGQTTTSAAFNALSPITTTGDLIIGNGTNSATRLAIGTNAYVLTSNGTTASWQPASGGGGTSSPIPKLQSWSIGAM